MSTAEARYREVPGLSPSLGVIMDVGPLWARLSEEIREQAWRLVKAGWHLEAKRILALALGDARQAQEVNAWLIKRKLHIHN